MASEDAKGKKRKAAQDAQPKPKKQKKSDVTATAPKKPAKATKAAVEPIDSLSTKVKPSRKRAEDFFSDDEAPAEAHTAKKKKSKKGEAEPVNGPAQMSGVVQKPKKAKKDKATVAEVPLESEAPKEKVKKSKKAKKSDVAKDAEDEVAVTEEVSVITETAKAKKSKKSKKQEEAPVEVVETVVEARDAEDDEELDDQTAALLAGFESDRDESDLEKEDEDINEEAVEKLPNLSKKQRKALEQVRKDAEPGVIFLGRIPHGFFEPQMKSYFSQFGTVTRLRLSRNKKTGASKHYAFIEFANADVADIVAKTMQNYLMFGHILQCKIIPPEQVHADLFKGANERFKIDPRNKKQGSAMARGAERAVWEKRVGNENKRRGRKAKILKDEFGYEFNAPAVKGIEDVPKKTPAVEDGPTQQLLTEAAAPEVTEVVQVTESKPDQLTVTETVKVKKPRKNTKGKGQTEVEVDEAVVAEAVQAPKAKKDKKRKSDTVAEVQAESEPTADAPAPKTGKAKKAKKAKA